MVRTFCHTRATLTGAKMGGLRSLLGAGGLGHREVTRLVTECPQVRLLGVKNTGIVWVRPGWRVLLGSGAAVGACFRCLILGRLYACVHVCCAAHAVLWGGCLPCLYGRAAPAETCHVHPSCTF